jgi:DNA-binding CsgD family transcriptional regulator
MSVSRSSPYRVVLSSEQERELARRAAAYSAPHRDVVRAKALLLAAEGLSNVQIAERLEVSRQAVSKWRKRFFALGLDGLEERPDPVVRGLFPNLLTDPWVVSSAGEGWAESAE